jgi:hypothetical protein
MLCNFSIRYGWGSYTPTSGTGFSTETGYNRWVEYSILKNDTPEFYASVYFYDKNDRLAEVRYLGSDDSTERKVKYAHDGFGNKVEVLRPDGNDIEYSFNGLNQMIQFVDRHFLCRDIYVLIYKPGKGNAGLRDFGYQVCHKWLKDRRGRVLTHEDVEHYKSIVVALGETIRIMSEIDEVIDSHGGWPGAFIQK